MDKKAVLILVDGMRPDGLTNCGNPYVEKLLKDSTYTFSGRTVMPSCTLPCHMSLFHSVDPARHGVTTNHYIEPVRPISGLFEQLDRADKKCAFFYSWEELRDLERMDHLYCALHLNQHKMSGTDQMLTKRAIEYINSELPDFMFLYLGETDEVGGHDAGWMSDTYLHCIANALDCVKQVREGIPADYDIILIADHGGHERNHGTDCPEDMTIPVVMNGPSFEKGKVLSCPVSIKDIAPTIADLLGAKPAKEWEGKSLKNC